MTDMINNNTITVGSFEHVSLPGLKMDNIIAKIDTGAYSGAIHCTDIQVIRRESDGKKLLRFKPSGRDENIVELESYYVAFVTSSSGHRDKRYIIETELILRNKSYNIRIGLSNRSDMKKEVLIGRRFLRQNNIIVDVRINQDLDDDPGETKK